MSEVPKGKFKAKALSYFRQIEETGEPLIVSDHGQAVLEIRPLKPQKATTSAVLAAYRSAGPSRLPSEAELLAPVPETTWNALSDEPDLAEW